MAGMSVRRWLPAALVAGAGAASLWARGRLPERVEVQFEDLLPFAGTTSETAARWPVLWLIPALALLVFALFRAAPTAMGQRFGRRLFRHAPAEVTSLAQFERFGRTYDTIVLAVVLLFVGVHAAMLAAALQASALAARILPVVLGVCLVMMGNVTPRLRPNWVAGLRSRRLLEDPQLWRRAHRVFGAALVVSGLATIVAGLVAPTWGVIVAVVSLLASCLIGWLASRRDGGAQRRASLAVLFLVCATASDALGQAPAAAPTPALSLSSHYVCSYAGSFGNATKLDNQEFLPRHPIVRSLAPPRKVIVGNVRVSSTCERVSGDGAPSCRRKGLSHRAAGFQPAITMREDGGRDADSPRWHC